ncbi:hypothetical protein [Bythopirellula goksoeyrii]|uniref:Uncharacterized protein n=1 Tax=Bythopirellula goksoeyrii TaxID=1400387 RepID=A0A5B9QA64_9BACT|nr:hypothetical protein [Bythopirellula goksoeyrii]QEG34639.1 hypothetical protein Pr1d_19210 [Bythopirellula goksoeyrii]
MNLLIQFLLRLCFGLAAGMAITSSRQVTSGYFRNHLYVTLGLSTLASLVSYTVAPEVFWYAVAAAVASYVGSVCWLYETRFLGKMILIVVALCCLNGGLRQQLRQYSIKWHSSPIMLNYLSQSVLEKRLAKDTFGLSQEMDRELRSFKSISDYLTMSSVSSSGLLLGMTMAAMLLGHWYLNTPTMELAPLRRLILAMGAAVAFQILVSALGLWGELEYANELSTQWWLFLLLRWSFGLVGVAVLTWMAWETLKIPNTQSATGILYVAVIGTFVGETMSLLLSAESLFPL